jgi:hypothetical protein
LSNSKTKGLSGAKDDHLDALYDISQPIQEAKEHETEQDMY